MEILVIGKYIPPDSINPNNLNLVSKLVLAGGPNPECGAGTVGVWSILGPMQLGQGGDGQDLALQGVMASACVEEGHLNHMVTTQFGPDSAAS